MLVKMHILRILTPFKSMPTFLIRMAYAKTIMWLAMTTSESAFREMLLASRLDSEFYAIEADTNHTERQFKDGVGYLCLCS